jgi:cell division protein FtsB
MFKHPVETATEGMVRNIVQLEKDKEELAREIIRLKDENDLLRHTIRTFENEEVKQRVIDHIKGINPNNMAGRIVITSDPNIEILR